MSLRPDTRDNAAAAAATLALDYGCSLPYAKRALWEMVLRYLQPYGMVGDVVQAEVTPAHVDVCYLDLRAEWDQNPPPRVVAALPPNPSPPCPCRFCVAQIRWADLNGKRHPFNLDGSSHFDTCTSPRRSRRAA